MRSLIKKIKKLPVAVKKRIGIFLDRRPFLSFFIVLGVLLVLIVISNILGTPKKTEKQEKPEVKTVSVYKVGSAPRMTVQAKIEKSGVITITALAPGIVASINKSAGEHVSQGTVLFNLSSNYQGGNTASLQRQLAQTQYQHVLDTYDLQKDLIQKQRDVAAKSDENASALRTISDQSLNDMNSLIGLNDDILSTLDQNIANLESTNTGGVNDDMILATKELKSQFLAANNAAKQASRSAQLASGDNAPPAELARMQKDITLKQLDLQEKMLDLNREISRIQLQIARVVEAMMYPTAPFSGTIQRVYVKEHEQVNPGTPLAVISQDVENDPVTAIAFVSQDIASRVSLLESSTIHIGQRVINVYPTFVSQDAVQGTLYGIYFSVPDQYASQVTDKGSVQIDIPLGYFDTGTAVPYIPIDAVYQTRDQSYVFVGNGGVAKAKEVVLGNVYGSFVEIQKGLGDRDMVILDRNVIAGDRVTLQ